MPVPSSPDQLLRNRQPDDGPGVTGLHLGYLLGGRGQGRDGLDGLHVVHDAAGLEAVGRVEAESDGSGADAEDGGPDEGFRGVAFFAFQEVLDFVEHRHFPPLGFRVFGFWVSGQKWTAAA